MGPFLQEHADLQRLTGVLTKSNGPSWPLILGWTALVISPLLCFHVSRPGRRADDGHGTAAVGPRRTLPTGAWQLPLLEDSFSLFSSRKGRRRSFTEEQRVLDTATGINLRSVAKMGSVAGTSFARHG